MDEKHQLPDDPPSHITEDQEGSVNETLFLFVCFFMKVAVLKVEIDIEIFKKKVIYLNFSIFLNYILSK